MGLKPLAGDAGTATTIEGPDAGGFRRYLHAQPAAGLSRPGSGGAGQSRLSANSWELPIIDNASKAPVANIWDVSSYRGIRYVTEGEIGIAAARWRGMREAAADLIVFVDDDNVVDKMYLSEAVKVKRAWPFLVEWGSGCIEAHYEVEPPEYLNKYLPLLALRDATGPFWSNFISVVDAIPWGAGLACARKSHARIAVSVSNRGFK